MFTRGSIIFAFNFSTSQLKLSVAIPQLRGTAADCDSQCLMMGRALRSQRAPARCVEHLQDGLAA